jgi:opacity protein-like surface antigen
MEVFVTGALVRRDTTLASQPGAARAFVRTLSVSLLLLSMVTLARPARAQVTLGLGGGATFPTGNLNSVYSTGWNALANLGVHFPAIPIGLRGDLMFNQLPVKSSFGTSAHTQIWTANANVVLSAPGPVSPYLIGGVGYYNHHYRVNLNGSTVAAGGSTTSNNVGINGGGGLDLKLPGTGIGLFAEARYHYVFVGSNHIAFIPITAGVTF